MPVSTQDKLTRLSVDVAGQSGLNVEMAPDGGAHFLDHIETRLYKADLGPTDASGHHIASGLARIPVSITPTHAWDIGGVRYPVDVTVLCLVAAFRRYRLTR